MSAADFLTRTLGLFAAVATFIAVLDWFWAASHHEARTRFGRGATCWALAAVLVLGQLVLNSWGAHWMLVAGTVALWGAGVPLLRQAWRAYVRDWPTGVRAVQR